MVCGESEAYTIMNHIYRKKPFWSVCGPFLIFMGIEMAVQTIAEMFIMIPYVSEMLAKNISENSSAIPTEDVMEVVEKTVEVMVAHQVEIAAVCALCTLPLTIFLFRKDRRLEKQYEVAVNRKAGLLKYPWLVLLGAAFSVGFTCLSTMAEAAILQWRVSGSTGDYLCGSISGADYLSGNFGASCRRDDVQGSTV